MNIQRNVIEHHAQGFHTLEPGNLNTMTINEMTDLLTLAYLLECRQDEYPSLVSVEDRRTIIWAKMPGFDWFAESVDNDQWRIWVRRESGEARATA